jgi:hypothetical protein
MDYTLILNDSLGADDSYDTYTSVPYISYTQLADKLNALLSGNVLLFKGFERAEKADVLVRLNQENDFLLSQISYDMTENVWNPRYWINFNVGINDITLITAFLFDEDTFYNYSPKYMINDIVNYTSADGEKDSAVIEAIYCVNNDPAKYAYSLSRDTNRLYLESELIQNVYQ